ncbi:MAG: GHKL domain-containing protein [Haliscomenobacteraceae bacterium CHB4]|nr:Adaptive-response sensory-kinase SasA [Saprospiraceae bacterium]MCE7922832.1 GHKL domain-containing protein [Haliscomenobacteraceae bacterium CHB4]
MELAPLILISIPAIYGIRKSLETPLRLPEWDKVLSKVWIGSIALFVLTLIPFLRFLGEWYGEVIYAILLITVFLLRDYRPARLYSLALLPYAVVYCINSLVAFIAPSLFEANHGLLVSAQNFAFLWLMGFGIYAFVQNNKEVKQRRKEEERIRQAETRKAELEHLVTERTVELTRQKEELEKTLSDLKAAQAQLVQSEKMASLGELTAGIAHEIQNPLNFVNNFSELSVELAHELVEEIEKPEPDKDLVKDLVKDLSQNQEKISHHGKRAASIVTGMLQHARTSTGAKEPTDLNALADEYLRLAYHGLRAKDKSFNAKMVTDFDPAIGKIEVVPQDLGRVLLNLINNAFYAVNQKKRSLAESDTYEPTVAVSTQRANRQIVIKVKDNGTGMPDGVKAKIFQPFFTTKPTGQGTGLGLSLAYDIVTKGHGGTLEVESKEGEGTTFVIKLPIKTYT